MPVTAELFTYQDLVEHLVDFGRANPSTEYYRDARRAIQLAMREFANAHQWLYWTKQGRLNTVAPYQTGTVTFDHTGGSSERILTIADGEWPTWAAFGVVVIDSVIYNVASRVSSTILQLAIESNPGADVAAGTAYILFRDTFPMPGDFISADQLYTPESWRRLSYIHPREWLVAHRYNVTSSNTPYFWTVMGSPDHQGIMAMRFYPYPDSAVSIDYIYQGRPRVLSVENQRAGTITVSADSTTVEGSNTVFTSDMVGSVFRHSDDAVDYPTGRMGVNPFTAERMVMSVTDADTLIVDAVFNTSYSDVKYNISDPVDIEAGAMLEAFLRCCEKQLGYTRRMKDRKELNDIWVEALLDAREADVRTRGPRSVYMEGLWTRRLAYMSSGEDIE